MENNIEVLRRMYDSFNARDIDGVLAQLADDVTWANGMDGGYVHGHEAVRDYWTRQWTMVSPLVEPKQFKKATDDFFISWMFNNQYVISKGSRFRIKRTGYKTN